MKQSTTSDERNFTERIKIPTSWRERKNQHTAVAGQLKALYKTFSSWSDLSSYPNTRCLKGQILAQKPSEANVTNQEPNHIKCRK